MSELRPILSALLRSRIALVVIGLQVAITLAIVCNALFLIVQRFEDMRRPSGLDEANTFEVTSLGFGAAFDVRNTVKDDLSTLRALPGVADAAPINRVPMGIAGWSNAIFLDAAQKTPTLSTAIYMVDEHAIGALGLHLAGGRNFNPGEIEFRDLTDPVWPPGVIVSAPLAEALFPGQSAVGKQIRLDQTQPPSTIIGVVDRLQAPWLHTTQTEYSTLVPQIRPYGEETRYLVRTEPGRRDEVMARAEAQLGASNPNRIVRNLEAMSDVRIEAYRSDRMMAVILIIVMVFLLTITALGIVGMASFWVAQRTRQIGTRRALGATRGAILRYFLAENFVITTIGLGLGLALTYAFNIWLMITYDTARLPWYYVVAGLACLWLLGQLAVMGPATRAARVPPAVAARS